MCLASCLTFPGLQNAILLLRTTLKLSIRTTMATTRALLLRPHQTLTLIQAHLLRSLSTSPPNHQFLSANDFLNSWTPHTDPKQAEARVREEGEGLSQGVHRGGGVGEDREAAQGRGQEGGYEDRQRGAEGGEGRVKEGEGGGEGDRGGGVQLKERTQKLEYWRLKEKHIEEKKKEKKELLRRKSSMWVDEAELEKKILVVIVDTQPL